MTSPASSVEEMAAVLSGEASTIAQKMRAIFFLRTRGGADAVAALTTAMTDKSAGALLRHEVAYVLGQMQDVLALPALTSVLQDVEDDSIVRHEAAEALGAIGQEESIDVLSSFLDDPAPEVSQTCQLAVELIKGGGHAATGGEDGEGKDDGAAVDPNPYDSVDPAPPAPKTMSTPELRELLLDESQSLFRRYKALFALRNRGGDEAVLAMGDSFADSTSALFRHEVAYVLGQMSDPVAIPALKSVLLNKEEHAMVRHEAAEALGSIGTEETDNLLKEYLHDDEQVVRESCEVALDMKVYWEAFAAKEKEAEAAAAGEVAVEG